MSHPADLFSSQDEFLNVPLRQRMTPERRRLAFGLLLSLLIHALLLTLTFNGQGVGLPGFGFPWQDRRAEAADLRVTLSPVPAPAIEPLQSAEKLVAEQPSAAAPTVLTVVSRAPPEPPKPPAPPATRSLPAKLKAAATVPKANAKKVAKAKKVVVAGAAPAPAISPAIAPAPAPAVRPIESAPPPVPNEEVIALASSNDPTWTVPPPPEVPAPVTAVAPAAPSSQAVVPSPRDVEDVKQEQARELAELDRARQEATQEAERQADQVRAERQEAEQQAAARQHVARQEAARQEAARQDTARQDAAKVETARLEVDRQEAVKQAAARQAAALQDAARQEVARAEAAKADAGRKEDARQAAVRQEAARQETVRQEATRVEAARAEAVRGEAERLEGERQGAARQEAARQDAARQEAARAEAARLATKQAEADQREERLRAIGRQLNEEADRRDVAAAAQQRDPSASSVRRGRLFGRADANAELILYAEAWSRKIQLNMTFDMVRDAAKQPHTDPLVTVAVRSDGSVESVIFVRSSGVPAIDEAIRRIVHSQANYQAFPPGLLRDYDVVEIRRTWHFDMAVRLY